MEIENIDTWGVMVQHKEEMLKSGKYVHFEVVVGRDDDFPFIQTKCSNYNSVMVAQLISILEARAKELRKKYPETNMILPLLNFRDLGTLKGGEED